MGSFSIIITEKMQNKRTEYLSLYIFLNFMNIFVNAIRSQNKKLTQCFVKCIPIGVQISWIPLWTIAMQALLHQWYPKMWFSVFHRLCHNRRWYLFVIKDRENPDIIILTLKYNKLHRHYISPRSRSVREVIIAFILSFWIFISPAPNGGSSTL